MKTEEIKESPELRYHRQMLDLVEKDLSENYMSINSLEVSLRKLNEERKELKDGRKALLRAICELEQLEDRTLTSPPNPKLSTDMFKHIFFRDGKEMEPVSGDFVKHDCSLEALKDSFKTEGDE